jgi:hypothetical protein
VREKLVMGTMGCRTANTDKLLVEPQVVVTLVCDTGGRQSLAGLGGKVTGAICVRACLHVCSVTAARKAHLGAKPLLTWSCHI